MERGGSRACDSRTIATHPKVSLRILAAVGFAAGIITTLVVLFAR